VPQQQPPPRTGFEFELDPKARFGTVSGPILGAGATFALTAVIWASEQLNPERGSLPVWLPLVIAVLGAAVTAVLPLFRPVRSEEIAFRLSCWAAAGLWSFLALTVFRDAFLLMSIALVVLAAFAMTLARNLFPPVDDNPAAAVQAAAGQAASYAHTPLGQIDAWSVAIQDRITKFLALREPETVSVERTMNWPNESGATFQVEFSVGSPKGLDDLQRIGTLLAQSMRLPDHCTIVAKKSGKQGIVLLDVMFFNDMATRYDFPLSWEMRSAQDDLPIAVHGDKTFASINVYQKSVVVIGIRGGGKTVLLQNITAWLMQCSDVVIWICDLNGGALAMPWTYGKVVGELDEFPVDWVAHNPHTALAMGEAAVRIAKKRKTAYAGMLMKKDTDKIPISPKVPMLMVIVDEGAELMGETASKMAMAATQEFLAAQRIGRAMCVNVIFCAQRATSDYIPAAAKRLAAIKIALRCDDDSEIAQLFGWKRLAYTVDDLGNDGSMIIRIDSKPARLAKGLFIAPSVIRACAKGTIAWRPKLDKISADAAGDDYKYRWQEPSTVQWLEDMAASSFDELDSLVDEDGAGLAEPTPAATAVAVMDRPEPRTPTGGRRDDEQNFTAPTVAQLDRDAADIDRIAAELGIPDFGAAGPGLDLGGGPGQPAGGGAHDRDQILNRKVDALASNPESILKEIEAIASLEPHNPERPGAAPADMPPPPRPAPATPPPAPVHTPPPAPDEPGPAVGKPLQTGKSWVLELLREHGGLMRVKDIYDAAMAAKVTERRASITEWLGELVTQDQVTSPQYGQYQAIRKPQD
jgi:hypothetical protein